MPGFAKRCHIIPRQKHELFLGGEDDPSRFIRLERTGHGGQLGAARRDGTRAGRRSRVAARYHSSGKHPQADHRARATMRRIGRRHPALLDGMGLLHANAAGRIRHGPLRVGTLLGENAGQPHPARSRRTTGERTSHPNNRRRPCRHGPFRRPALPFARALHRHAHLDRHRLSAGDRRRNGRRVETAPEAGPAERDIFASYVHDAFLSALAASGKPIAFQFSFAAEPMPHETASIVPQRSISHLADVAARHPKVKFVCFVSSRHANQSICTLCSELPNFSLAGYWWHNFFPDAIRQVIGERLDMLPVNKQVGFFSDAYCIEWTYGKTLLVRKQLARVFADKIEQSNIRRRMPWRSPSHLVRDAAEPARHVSRMKSSFRVMVQRLFTS